MNPRLVVPAVGAAVFFTVMIALYGADDAADVHTDATDPRITITDGVRHIIPLDKIRSGGPARDAIPSIDAPVFTAADDAGHVDDSDIVLGLEINGDARAYPLSILVWHEIVNDVVGATPVAVTYCPLCYTSQVFERVLDGTMVEFGTSGKLYNSNLVMYDRTTESYWSQALGQAIAGELAGQCLKIIAFDVIMWGDWKALHPDSLVLGTDTGNARPYGTDPYGDYYTSEGVWFPVENLDGRMHPKEIILGLDMGDTYKAYKQADLDGAGLINDRVGNIPILLVSMFEGNARAFDRNLNGEVLDFEFTGERILDLQTRSEWDYSGTAVLGPHKGESLQRLAASPGFWFEWASFHPDTLVYEQT